MMDEAKRTKKVKKRSETVSVRFEPRLRYLAEVAARVQRRTLSSFVEWAVETSLAHVTIGPGRSMHWLFYKGMSEEASEELQATIADVANELWVVNEEADRFVHLAFEYEHLLNHDEQVVWKLIRERLYFWRESTPLPPDMLTEDPLGRHYNPPKYIPELTRVREYWDHLKAVAQGQEPSSTLPAMDKPPAKAPAQATPTPKVVNRKSRKG